MAGPETLEIALQAAPQGGGMGSTVFMLVAFVAIFYFVLIRPQQKEAKDHAALVSSLQKGDRVVTTSGIHGKIHEAKGDTLVLEISTNAYITVDRDAIRRKVVDTPPAAAKGS